MTAWTIVRRDTRDQLGEGTLWSARHNALFWVDILAPALNRLSLATGRVDRWTMPEPIGWVVERSSGGFIVGLRSGFAALDLEPFVLRPLADPEPHLPGNRMNDGKADRFGRIWCGTMDSAGQDRCGSLYRLDSDLSWTTMDRDYVVPNGPAFARDGGWLYHTDTALRAIYRFRLDDDGALGGREPFIRFDEASGFPDGMAVDSDDGLWVAHWGGGRISRYRADGMFDRAIDLPVRNITNIAFAGPALDRMFVSSAVDDADPRPDDGALFEIAAGAVGLPPYLFAG